MPNDSNLYARVFAANKPLQPSLMSAGKVGAHPWSSKHVVNSLSSLTNIRFGSKWLSETNTLAYFVAKSLMKNSIFKKMDSGKYSPT